MKIVRSLLIALIPLMAVLTIALASLGPAHTAPGSLLGPVHQWLAGQGVRVIQQARLAVRGEVESPAPTPIPSPTPAPTSTAGPAARPPAEPGRSTAAWRSHPLFHNQPRHHQALGGNSG